MRSNSRKASNNYYKTNFPDYYVARRQITICALSFAALIMYLPTLIFWIYPGLRVTLWIYESLEATIAFFVFAFGGLAGLIFCSIYNFYGYRIRKEMKEGDAPITGFKRTAYYGQLATLVFVTAFSAYLIILNVGYVFASIAGYIDEVVKKVLLDNPNSAARGGISIISIVCGVCTGLSGILIWNYYFFSWRAYKSMEFVRIDPPNTKKNDSNKTGSRVSSVNGLTDLEIEMSKREFACTDETADTNNNGDRTDETADTNNNGDRTDDTQKSED